MKAQPLAARPHMPGYGLRPGNEGTGLLPWSWALGRLRDSHDYWLSTRRPDGRPHLMPVWALWLQDALWFSCSAASRKAANLAAEPRCSLSTDDALNPVVVEGTAQVRDAERDRQRFIEAMNAKYEVALDVDFLDGVANLCLRVQPVVAFGMLHGDFTGSPTRWSFR